MVPGGSGQSTPFPTEVVEVTTASPTTSHVLQIGTPTRPRPRRVIRATPERRSHTVRVQTLLRINLYNLITYGGIWQQRLSLRVCGIEMLNYKYKLSGKLFRNGNLRLERVKKILALVPPQDASSSDSSEDDNEINITDNTEYSSEPRSLDSSFERLNILENDEFFPEDIIPSTPAISEVLATYNPPQHLPALQSISSVLSMSPSPVAATIVKETRSKKKLTTNLPHSLTKKKKAFLRKPLEFKWEGVWFGIEVSIRLFCGFFSEDVINIIIENTNLYAVQRNLKSINLTRDELLDFIAINLLMGVVKMPSYRDYWKKDLRYNLIADVMSLKRYEQICQFLHFVDNSQQNGDRYFKVRPILEASIKHKPAIVYFDNFFSSLELINLLRGEYGIFSLGTIRANRLRGCQEKLPSDKDLLKKGRGSSKQVVCNKNKLSVVKWHDNKSVILASSYVDSFPMETIRRYSKETKSKIDIPCPQIVKHYNSHMGGVDLCDMLISLYRTNYKTKRWYMALFSQVLDICVNNAWIMYRKDSARYNKVPNSLKIFRIMIYYELLSKHRTPATTSTPTDAIRCDNIGHMPDYTTAPGRCKFCKKGDDKGYLLQMQFKIMFCQKPSNISIGDNSSPDGEWTEETAILNHFPFTGTPEIKIPEASSKGPVDYFKSFFSIEFMTELAHVTNNHAQKLRRNSLKSHSRLNNCKNTGASELYTFLGIIIYLGCLGLTKIADYWKKTYLHVTNVNKYMSRDRF
ncbi:hypothetical protein HW555_003935 [Spodoptera exigua]|uniref:PiggyBac transposable element-derived protein domain-containing protein n=1 Tax=Spodoptera exigua TaxID=7107 RepID=A0A835GMU4_SPOEX|nr:hypothetical protein HW555_003935 [Spodoptera exigua]